MRPYGALDDDRDAGQSGEPEITTYKPARAGAADQGSTQVPEAEASSAVPIVSTAHTVPVQTPDLDLSPNTVSGLNSGSATDTGAGSADYAPVQVLRHVYADEDGDTDLDADAGEGVDDSGYTPVRATISTDDRDTGEVSADDPEAIRANIEQTRAELSDTINAIQEKLNPQVLMDQAKDTLQDTANTVMEKARDTVHEATVGRVEQMVDNVTGTAKDTGGNIIQMVKDNPLPAALLGLGLGWLFMRNRGNSNDRGGYYGPYPYYPYPPRGSASPYALDEPESRYVPRASQQSSSIVEQVVDKVKQNPVPAVLTGACIGWMLMGGNSNPNRSSAGTSYQGSYGYRSGSGSQGASSNSSGTSNAVGQAQDKLGNVAAQVGDTVGGVAGSVGDIAGQAGDTLGSVAGQVRDTAGDVAGTVAQTAGDVAGGVAQAAGNVAGGAGDAGGRLLRTIAENPLPSALAAIGIGWLIMQNNSGGQQKLQQAGQTVGDVAGQAGDAAGQLVGAAGDTVSNVAGAVQQGAAQTQTQFQRMFLQNPLAIGALAVAAGAAVGLAVPETPQEHQLMGETRDRLLERAQSVAQDTLQKVQDTTQDITQQVQDTVSDAQDNIQDQVQSMAQS